MTSSLALKTDYPVLDKLFELYLFMQTVVPRENHVDSFFLTHNQSPEIMNLDVIFPYMNSPDILGCSDISFI